MSGTYDSGAEKLFIEDNFPVWKSYNVKNVCTSCAARNYPETKHSPTTSKTMIASPHLFVSFLCLTIFYYASSIILSSIQYNRKTQAFGCGKIKKYRHYDPILGLDFALSMRKAFQEHRWLPWQKELYRDQGVKTFTATFLGSRMIYSAESDNMKAMSTAKWKDFGIQPLRLDNGVTGPFHAIGVSNVDGEMWEFSRNLIKPYFTRDGYSDLGRLKVHTDRLLSLVPLDGTAFDIQPLMQRWFLDTSTEFLFGKTLNSLTYPTKVKISIAMVDVMRGLRARLQMAKLMFLHYDPVWLRNVQTVKDFIDANVKSTLAERSKCIASGNKSSRTDLLWDMVRQVQDPEVLRGQILAVFVPSNDTTSILISNAFYALSRHPEVYSKLRKKVLALGDQELNFEKLRSISYLAWVLNEVHRLYPNGILMVRQALTDTTLPVGGGQDQAAPIFVAKGDIVSCNRYLMHRDLDIWGPDAEEFNPERWREARPMWKFVPFGGGPRICPAHVLVMTEASYVLCRFAQRFEKIEAKDDRPYTAIMRIGPSNMHGVKISAVKDEKATL
ncbi:cytochrome P450 monooxygenase [Lentithecium fluviatile CBS 122367]|uniref:Cytochrome P450 monooxygenase n=1 Tax=Lentithecium fluviatile CBS 122367 TaxID=1168545 RepID=A0A6G1J7J1_9PLEO|nr:cytochrome P450 monooxygenase [Lentithecium fluviatile CBS 122367]